MLLMHGLGTLNTLVPGHSVGPDLETVYKVYQQMAIVAASKERVKMVSISVECCE